MDYDEDEDDEIESDIFETQNCMTCQTTKIVEARDPGNRESYLRMALIELFFHFFFLIIIIYISDNNNNKLLYDINNSINSLFFESSISPDFPFVTFRNISTHYHAWEFMKNHMLESIYWELEYEGRNITDEEIGYVLYKNKLKYFVQLRQIRTEKYGCEVNKIMRDCYHKYGSVDYLDTRPINISSKSGLTQNKFSLENDLGYLMYLGRAGMYGDEGFTVRLKKTKAETKVQLETLYNNSWIDRSTRVVFIEFVLYNQELLNYCFVRIVLEFPVGGGVMSSNKVLSVRVFQFDAASLDVLALLMHLFFMIYIFYYLLLMIIELLEFKLTYFLSLSSYIDMTIVLISITGLCVYFWALFSIISYNEHTIPSKEAIYFGYTFSYTYTIMSVVFCLAFIKLFKYLNFNATLWSLSKTIYLCSVDVFCLLILTAEIYMAFAVFGHLLFGYEKEEFSTICYSLGSMVRVLLGDLDFKAFNGLIDIVSFLFMVTFQMSIYFLFFALFLAIILTSYQQVGLLHQKQKFEMQMLEFTYRKIAQLFRKKYNEPPLISVKEWAKTMLDLGHPSDAAHIVIGKYKSQGIDKESYLTYPQQDELTYELEYYIKSEYMKEKARLIFLGFHKLKNLYTVKSNPFPASDSRTKVVSVISRMLNDIKEMENMTPAEQKKAMAKITVEVDKRRNLFLPSNTPIKY